jgi:hypothetical protein
MSFNESQRYYYDLDEDSVVFDLGGYKGQFSETIYKEFGCKPHLFEPVFEPTGNFTFYPFALGARTREEKILVDGDKTGIGCKSGTEKKILVFDIVPILEELGEDIDLMKINIEGMEYEVIPRLIQSGWIKRIKNLQVQFHRIAPNSDRDMWIIQNDLKATHDLSWQFRFIWESWRLRAM